MSLDERHVVKLTASLPALRELTFCCGGGRGGGSVKGVGGGEEAFRQAVTAARGRARALGPPPGQDQGPLVLHLGRFAVM